MSKKKTNYGFKKMDKIPPSKTKMFDKKIEIQLYTKII